MTCSLPWRKRYSAGWRTAPTTLVSACPGSVLTGQLSGCAAALCGRHAPAGSPGKPFFPFPFPFGRAAAACPPLLTPPLARDSQPAGKPRDRRRLELPGSPFYLWVSGAAQIHDCRYPPHPLCRLSMPHSYPSPYRIFRGILRSCIWSMAKNAIFPGR